MISDKDMARALDYAKAASMAAGKIVRGVRENIEFSIDHKPNDGIVTTADLKAGEYLTNRLRAYSAEYSVISEEDARREAPGAFCWLVDPLDGSMNFAHGLDHVAVSVGLTYQQQSILGVVHAPFLGQTFWARKGGGAFRDGRRISTRARPAELALIAVGFPHDRSDVSAIVDRLKPLLQHFGDVRRLAAPALDICWVADGRLDGFLDRIQPWDVAAAGIIASEAGATVSILSDGKPEAGIFAPADYLVAPPALHARILHVLNGGGDE